VFAFRLRVLDVRLRSGDLQSYLGIVEGFPMIMAQAESVGECEAQVTRLLVAYLEGLRDEAATRIQLDDFPSTRAVLLFLQPIPG
jgi:predicted RNase H-like HicB family nuclease